MRERTRELEDAVEVIGLFDIELVELSRPEVQLDIIATSEDEAVEDGLSEEEERADVLFRTLEVDALVADAGTDVLLTELESEALVVEIGTEVLLPAIEDEVTVQEAA